MKKMTCRELAGACDEVFTGETLQELGEKSKKHVMELIANDDHSHDAKMEEMKNRSPEEQQALWASMEQKFEDAPEA